MTCRIYINENNIVKSVTRELCVTQHSIVIITVFVYIKTLKYANKYYLLKKPFTPVYLASRSVLKFQFSFR